MWTLSLAAAGILLAGCATSQAATTTTSTNSMPGMSMAPGQTMAPSATTGPSAAAQMVCSEDIKDKVKQVLNLPATPAAHSTFADHRFTCTYDLPMGPLTLAVQDSPSKTAAGMYFTSLRPTLGTTDTLIGLGERSYGTPSGTVVVLKDSQTLVVDATGLPTVFGAQHEKRTDLAYEIASDVLGCWTNG
jgi:hypothetical protein